MPTFRAPVGTHDVLAPESARWSALVGLFVDEARRAGFGLLVSPLFEDVGVFERVGESTEVVRKEMYVFRDRGERALALRPEGTAPVVRAYLEHKPNLPFKACYVAPSFRYEKPQAGRYRQHHQLGAEVLGSPDPDVDVEVIALAWRVVERLGLRRVRLLVNSLGDPPERAAYVAALADYLGARADRLSDEARATLAVNPLRVLDAKRPGDVAVVAGAPQMADHLGEASRAHHRRVLAGLDALGIAWEPAPRLVRGLDYYTRTTFELAADALDAAQNAVGGGGRYDGLAEALGGPPTPGMGFGLGVERLLLAATAEGTFAAPSASCAVFVVDTAGGEHARDLTHELRRAGIAADRAFDGRSMKAQMRAADRSGAVLALIVGTEELEANAVVLRPLRPGDGEQEVVPRSQTVERVRAVLAHAGHPHVPAVLPVVVHNAPDEP